MNIIEIKSKNGYKVYSLNGFLLHSKYNPIKEARDIIKNKYRENIIPIFFGSGNGYIINSFLEEYPKSVFCVYEPNRTIFEEFGQYNENYFYEIRDLKFFLERNILNYDVNIDVICSPNYDKLYTREYKELLELVKERQYESIINANTVNHLSETWQKNYIYNLSTLIESFSLKALKDKYDMPVVIAASGPSLIKQLNIVREYREKIILIAAGSTVSSLMKYDLEPDYIVSVDGSEINKTHFETHKFKKAKLIYSLHNYYEIQRIFKNDKFAFLPWGEIGAKQYLQQKFNLDIPFILNGGSVANFSLHIATYISKGPIALIGQDLAFTDNKTHSDGNNQMKIISNEQFNTKDYFLVEGYNGDFVYTNHAFQSMSNAFTRIYQLVKDKSVIYNCTEGGRKIESLPQISFRDFIVTYTNKIEKSEIVKDSKRAISTTVLNINDLKEVFKSEIRVYEEILKRLDIGIGNLKKEKGDLFFSYELLDELEALDCFLKESFAKVAMNRILDPIIMEIMKSFKAKNEESPQEKKERIYNQNITLYREVKIAVEKSLAFTTQALLKMEK